MKRTLVTFVGVAVLGAALAAAPALAAGTGGTDSVAQAAKKKKGKKTYKVCKRGCKYRTIQKAVDKVKKGKKSVIKVKKGKYKEGVIVSGHSYDKLTIKGASKNAKKVVLQGKNAKSSAHGAGASLAQNGIEGINVSGLKMLNMTAKNYAANGFFVHADPGNTCDGFKMKNLNAGFNRSYGLFAKHCMGGSITDSSGWGHGDSAVYIGETPPQDNPKWTDISNVKMYENVLGYSGTNSRYVDIHDNLIYNNGVGVTPNTLDSELFEPTEFGKIHDNKIFWNNFNYYLPGSPVKTVSSGLGEFAGSTINYPTGIGVLLFGGNSWQVYDNDIFGNFFVGAGALSDFSNPDALSQHNQFRDNQMGRGGTDTNQHDFYNDGSGTANCFQGNTSSSFLLAGGNSAAKFYPTCPGAGTGTGTTDGDFAQTVAGFGIALADPPCKQQDSWAPHPHPGFKGLTPIDTEDFGTCQ